ncbi:hypothetical protein Tco_0006716 [Tanacetum coccineum]
MRRDVNPLFEFDDKCISSDVNPLFDEVLEDIECKDSYDSNLDESTFLVTSLSDSNEDGFFTPKDDVELLHHHYPSISIVSILEGFIDEPPLKENDDLFDLESKENDWKKILYDAPIDDLITEDKFAASCWLFDEVLEDIECKDSYDSNLDESTFLVTYLFDSNEDGFFTPRDDVELLLHHDPSISIVSILEGFIDEPPLEENDDLFDLESKENDWKKILYDAPIDDLITEDKFFNPEIYEKGFSPTFVKLTFEDRHYLPIIFVIRIFLPYLTYSVDSPFLLSSGSEDTIFNPDISTFHFSSLNPVAYENPMVIFLFFCFCPKDKGISGRVKLETRTKTSASQEYSVSHAEDDVDNFKRCCTSYTFLVGYRELIDLILHRSSINNSASLSNKFGGFYFIFKFGISGLLHQVITTIADRIRGGSLLALKCLVWFMKYYANVRRTVADFSHAPPNEYSPSPDDKKQWSLGCWFGGKLIQKLRQKGVYEESFSRHAAWIGGKLIQFMHTTMVPVQVKTMKIQAGVQVSRQGELRRHLQLWKCFGRLYFFMFLEKPRESDGFTEIIDFLKASSVHYALTVNPTIYTSCIKQFWATAKVKMVNDVRQIQALIDKKKLIITETSIRSDLHLEDAGGTDCLPTATIFEELARMSAKSTACNEFSSIMASLIIYLVTNQKCNLSKYIFDAMVKHLDEGVKFLMYPRFLQVFINQQLGDMSHHKKIYINPSHTKKFFANMKREGKDFSGRITPLFDTMMVQASEEVGEDSDHPTDSNQIPIVDQPSTSSPPKKKQKSKRKHRKEAKVAHDETEHEESVPTPSNDPLPSGEDSMQLNDLMVLCTKLQKQVLDLEKAKSDQAIEIASLKKRVDKLEKRRKFRTTGLKRLKKVGAARRIESSNDSLGAQEDASKQGRRIEDIDADAEVTLVNETQERQDEDLTFDTGVLDGDEMFVDATTGDEGVTAAKIDELTLAQTLIEIKAAKPKVVITAATTTTTTRPKARGVVVQEPSEFRTSSEAQPSKSKDKGKEKVKEANIALIESWENTQAMMEADRLLAERLQTREREELTDEEKGKLFMELMEKRRKHFAALRAQEKRNRPPTKAQKRSQMSTYLKHMGGYKHKQLMGKSYDEIQKLFDKEMKRVNTFVAMSSETQESNEKKVEGSEEKAKSSRKKSLGKKRAVREQQLESPKRQKLGDDKETDEHEEVEADDTAELKKHLVIKKDDDIAIDVIPLATKPLVIVDYKLLKEGIMVHYQLIRADGSSKRHSSMIRLL